MTPRPPVPPPLIPRPTARVLAPAVPPPPPPIVPKTAESIPDDLPAAEPTAADDASEAENKEVLPRAGILYDEEEADHPGQLSARQAADASLPHLADLWRTINKGFDHTSFVTVVRRGELPKRMTKEHPAGDRPVIKGKMVGWCCYCGTWRVYEAFTYIGSQRCICCGISTKDYYNRSANNLWKVEL